MHICKKYSTFAPQNGKIAMQHPNLYIIACPNGAGKTTASFNLLPNILHCPNFVNADEIARGLSPFAPEMVAFQAGRIMFAHRGVIAAESRFCDRNDSGNTFVRAARTSRTSVRI